MLDANGDKYEGNWKDNLKEGKGTFYFSHNANILRFEGQWKADKKCGYGSLIYIDGSILYCYWDKDEKQLEKPVSWRPIS